MAKDNDALSLNDIITIGFQDGSTYADFGQNNYIDHGFWINDLYFQVPPERISSQEENAYSQSQALRSNNSFKIPVGIANEIITISFNIPCKSSITNIDTREDQSVPSNTGKRGGIFDLILQ
ncbi:MAG: hypothetical protein EB127_31465, partial [Alphaproteobacteria bacterium]|nr:hypothetical protein [Alphaproteobacteria bacterium]